MGKMVVLFSHLTALAPARPHDGLKGVGRVVELAEARAREVDGMREGLLEERRKLDENAVRVLHQLGAFFDQMARHRTVLRERVRSVRKRACQPASDAALVCRVLRLVCGVEGARLLGGEVEEHVRLALVACRYASCEPARANPRVVKFAVRGDAETWRRACCVDVVGGEWRARAGAVSVSVPSLRTGRRSHAAAVTLASGVLVVGGEGPSQRLASVERLEWLGSTWQAAKALPFPRFQCGTCVVGSALIVAGGKTQTCFACDSVDAVDVVSGARTRLPQLPLKLFSCGAVCEQGQVVVTGGKDASWTVRSNVWALRVERDPRSPRAPRWVPLPDMTQARHAHGAAAGCGHVFVCGGESRFGALDSCEMLRLGAGWEEWRELPPIPARLHSMGCCFGGGNVFVAGGAPDFQRSVFALSTSEWTWVRVAELTTSRCKCAAVCVGKCVLVLGGYGANGEALDSCEVVHF